jgi:hypothetical protein
MAGDLTWISVEFQIEAPIPGVVFLAETLYYSSRSYSPVADGGIQGGFPIASSVRQDSSRSATPSAS